MAKKKKRSGRLVKARPGGPSHVAAVRWYALKIELRALELVSTDVALYEQVRAVLRRANSALEAIAGSREGAESECSPPWDICPDGICRPDCGDVRLPGGGLPLEERRED